MQDNRLHLNDLVYWINQARSDPKSFIPFLQKHLESFRNDYQLEYAPNSFVKTQEGKKAWIEAIEFLKYQQPVPRLIRHSGLDRAAEDHAIDLSKNDLMGSIGSDFSTFASRIKRYCDFQEGLIGQTVGQEFKKKGGNSGKQTVLSLIVSDGMTDRVDRKSIFNPDFKYFGASIQNNVIRFVTVIDYSSIDLKELKGGNVWQEKSPNHYEHSTLTKTTSLNTNDSENNSRVFNGNGVGDGRYGVGGIQRLSYN